jgi:hypothetical protein
MNKGMTDMTNTILTDMNELTDVLRGYGGSDYAIGWLQSMVTDMARNHELKLTKKQVSALQVYVQKNIEWAEATKRSNAA